MKILSIVFSFRNEEKNLNELIKRVTNTIKELDGWGYELVFVNDDSDDNSEKTLLESQMTKGSHQVNWLGKDKFGKSVPTGIYIYQI